MQVSDTLIQKFFRQECTAEEAQLVAEYLRENPVVAEKFLNTDWSKAGLDSTVHPDVTSEMWTKITEQTIQRGQRETPRYMRWISIAASLLLVMAAWILLQDQNTTVNNIVQAKQSLDKTAPGNTTVLHNRGAAPVQFILSDGSQVVLSPNAQLQFVDQFTSNKREVLLTGEGLFKVIKDSTRPFTVIAGKFSTTALGTTFKVSDLPGRYEVKLIEGKLLVKAVQPDLAGWEKNIMLMPGQVMTYDVAKRLSTVTSLVQQTEHLARDKTVVDNGEAIKFHNTELTLAFRQLAKHYKQKIIYSNTDLKGMFFSGVVLKQDSLEMILKVIAQMNSLTVTKTDTGFDVKKLQ